MKPQTCLIRGDFIVAAQLFNTYPKKEIGFTERGIALGLGGVVLHTEQRQLLSQAMMGGP